MTEGGPAPLYAGGRGRQGPAGLGMTALALVCSGVLVNVLLAIVARSVSPAEYAVFSLFWSVALIAGFGVFLPVEQWLAERSPSPQGIAAHAARVARLVIVMVVIEALVVLLALGGLFWSLGGRLAMLGALVALCVVSGAQFLARGAMIGGRRLDLFAGVLVLDALIRVGVALVLSARGEDSATPYAWAVVAAIGLAHIPVLVVIFRRADRGKASPSESPIRPVLLLLVGAVGAQILFNGPAVAVTAVASTPDLPEVATFQAAFQLVRIPLFLAIPMQATLIPVMTRVLERGERGERTSLILRFAGGVLLLVGLGAGTGWLLGPWLVHLIFGAQYDAGRVIVAVLAAGVAAYLGLLVLTQAFVAEGRHHTVGASWGFGVLVAVAVFWSVPDGVAAASLSFASGCAAGLACGLLAALRTSSR